MYNIEDLVGAVLAEPKGATDTVPEAASFKKEDDWEKLASQLDEAARKLEEKNDEESLGRIDNFRMKKLAMAVVLDTIDDPKTKHLMEKLGKESLEGIKTAFQSPEPGSVGDLAQLTNSDTASFVKEKMGTKRTLFHRLKTNAESTPNSEGKK